MSQANYEDFLALLAAIEEAMEDERYKEQIRPAPAKEIDWLRRDRFYRSESQQGPDLQTRLAIFRRERYKELYERAWKLWQPGMTDLPPQELDIGAGLFALGIWCKRILAEEKPADAGPPWSDQKPTTQGQGDGPSGKAAGGRRSKPMSQAKMMRALRIDSPKTFKAWVADKDLQPAGNHQTWTICLDRLDPYTIEKLEKA